MKEYFKKHLINSGGKQSSRKLFVFESDDWGSIRIPDKATQNYLLNEKLIKLIDPFSAFDCLESSTDYQALFNVLGNYQDNCGNHPVITANMVMVNPDFQRIKDNDFKFFHFEPFYETYESYYPNNGTFEALLKGVDQNFIYPQFHAREHLNAMQWLKRLQIGDKSFLKAFDVNCFAINDNALGNNRANLMASYDYQYKEELDFIIESIKEGLQLYKQIFGFQSKTSIAPCYIWNEEIEDVFNQNGVKGIQGSYVQIKNNKGKHERVWRKMGSKNMLGQTYFVRNVLFEPALSTKINWVDKAMESIAIAFFWGKPAVLSSHRINYVAGLSLENRNNALEQLDELISRVLNRWPDIEFINSEQLLDAYS